MTTHPNPATHAQHTPTPWKVGHNVLVNSYTYEAAIWDGDGETVALLHRCYKQYGDNDAAFIVRACNSHAGLVAALEENTKWLEAVSKEYPKAAENLTIRAQLNRKLLAAAKEGA